MTLYIAYAITTLYLLSIAWTALKTIKTTRACPDKSST